MQRLLAREAVVDINTSGIGTCIRTNFRGAFGSLSDIATLTTACRKLQQLSQNGVDTLRLARCSMAEYA